MWIYGGGRYDGINDLLVIDLDDKFIILRFFFIDFFVLFISLGLVIVEVK